MSTRDLLWATAASVTAVCIVAIAASAQTAVPNSVAHPRTADPRLHAYLAKASQAMQSGDNTSAEESLRHAIEIDPRSLQALNDLGIVLARLGRPAEAIPFYREAIRIRPDPATKRNLAIAYFKAGQYANAWSMLRPMAIERSADFQALELAGLSLFGLDRYPEAAQYLERANLAQPSDLGTLDMLGKAYLRTKNYKALTSVFARIMKVNPNSAAAHIMMGTAYDDMQQRSDAIKEYQLAEKSDPNFQGVHSGLGYLYFRQGDTELAEKEFRAELQRFPDDPVSNCYLGEILLNNGRTADAEPLFQTAIKVNARYTEALLGLGRTELAMNHPDAAIEPLRKAVQIDPNDFQAHYILGTALRDIGQNAEAAREQKLSLDIQEKSRAAAIRKNENK
jgi:tetratricopeptide (TPR) repeat protein